MTADVGSFPEGDGSCRFRVWAPRAARVEVVPIRPSGPPVALEPRPRGYHEGRAARIDPAQTYRYRLTLPGRDSGAVIARPDPASRFQPEGVHGPTQVIRRPPTGGADGDDWRGLPLERYVMYELHVGTFTPEGTFDAIHPHLPALRDLGVTAIELLPVAQFPGNRNWGYDGVFPYAVQDSYGGPEGLRRLVSACHRHSLAVVLDVVYNHLGPEGNYLADFGPYFSDRHRTPWGAAINFDGPGSDEVRAYFIGTALQWIVDFRIDALRLDAIHGIVDTSSYPFLEEVADAVRAATRGSGRQVHLISESDLNDIRVLHPPERGGHGHDAQWNDDFHHALRTLLTGERRGYYEDFGRIDHLATAWRRGFVYAGEHSVHRGRRHGRPVDPIDPARLVVFSQNHDQVGNRMLGDRLSQTASLETLKLAAATVILSPYLPLLFMGEEYGETAPFLYFVSHGDPALIEAVRRGRREEFASFGWKGETPDPQDPATFRRSKLDHGLAERGQHGALRAFYRHLLALRASHPGLRMLTRDGLSVEVAGTPGPDGERRVLAVRRGTGADRLFLLFNFADRRIEIPPPEEGPLTCLLDSSAADWDGPGAPPSGRTTLILNPRSAVVLAPKPEESR